MRTFDALAAALAMQKYPQYARVAQTAPLPKGMTFLLEVAAGDAGTLSDAAAITGLAHADLEKAAGFFIEQVLLAPQADSYRVLGATPQTPDSDLRRHMALIMKWLHPDLSPNGASGFQFDKTVHVNRVTGAWENVKTHARRAAYDASRTSKNGKIVTRRSSRPLFALPHPSLPGRKIKRHRQLALFQLKSGSFWNRLLFLLGGRP
ncbi:MAG: hypothetical protein HY765_02175 [Rhodomicrobium sp.]|nr:hypothetical protein [Rhodomicrobium sp.]